MGVSETVQVTVAVPDAAIAAVYEWACGHARYRAKGATEVEDELTDAATNAVMWAIKNCTDATTFENFAKAAVRRWVWRQMHRIKRKRANRPRAADPTTEGTIESMCARTEKPVRPVLMDDLPEDLAFIVRLYLTDGFSMREIGLLTGRSPNTVQVHLTKAAKLLHDGPLVTPSRRNGEKRLTAG
ncbi:Sigma-70, region 4 [Gemmata obscuriglobus]|uniref:Sigma-70 family RNA polymerase sigma factor n=1 Tax=Gemmata obscuriglobus TaxID=114 RepID=A0A2Z3H5U8_9BACT|nr:sigma-70 family RNA polymerase sigma factor [Gemmata obscuriglobus]AWM40271.1 sigma-70 family RNA polymerase sigma factor [Gemmata obscuriglobus]QEG26529.1 Sigma-70, region 4 [Gemmata obscuriglobus]VTS01874.1 hypothetical protein : : Sigma70_r4_2 [Gemmata obscuriglobus UQM 2246]